MLCGRGWLGKRIFRDLLHQPQEDVQNYVVRFLNKNVYYPAYVFEEQKEVEIEGEHFFIPVDAEKYLMTSYGANYRDKGPENYRQSAIAVCSTLIPCEEFMQQGKDLKRLASRRKRRARRQKFGLSYREYFNQCWNYAKLCGKKYTCARAYRKKLDYIRNLHKNQDYVQLEIVFGRYTDMMNKCLKYDEIFEADPELLDIYIQYLEKTGRVGFMEKVKKYV